MSDKKGKLSAKGVESALFGSTANDDIFRFLQVGDAYFEEGCEVAYRMVNLNVRKKDSLMDDSKPQAVEAISDDFESEFNMKISKEHYEYASTHGGNLKELPAGMDSLPSLFKLVNGHTRKLVKEEIAYWQEIEEEKEGAEDYISSMRQILKRNKPMRRGERVRIAYWACFGMAVYYGCVVGNVYDGRLEG